MSSAIISSLLATHPQVVIYAGIPILIAGLIGGLLNTIVFLSLKTFRQSSCAFYLTILSIANLGQLMSGLFSRIMISGFNIDWTQSSLFYCKFRTFAFQVTSTISFTCICLATIDQYLATCSRIQWHRWCNIKIAHRIMLVTILVAVIIQSPCIIFYDHVISLTTGMTVCETTNNSFVLFNTYFNYLFIGNILPYIITFIFGSMAYRNIRELSYRTVPLVRRELDKQLTVIVLVQIVYNCFTLIPAFIFYIILSYGNIQDVPLATKLVAIYSITVPLYYTYYASPFYIYMCVSERFRRQLIYVLSKLSLNQCRKRTINPV